MFWREGTTTANLRSALASLENTSRKLTSDQLNDLWMYRIGKHSEFPECCILWFIQGHKSTHLAWISYLQHVEKLSGENKYNLHRGYIPCPDCLYENRKVTIHRCTTECEEKFKEDFRKEILNDNNENKRAAS